MTGAVSLPTLAQDQLAAARASSAGRSARTIHGGQRNALRQTVLALIGGQALATTTAPARPPCRC